MLQLKYNMPVMGIELTASCRQYYSYIYFIIFYLKFVSSDNK